MGYEWAFIANWLIFGGLTMLYADPFDMFGSDDDDNRADDDGRNWTRGGAETLSGGEGNDFLFFTPDDIADGGSGQDSFNLILTPEGGPATISDFDPADDQLTLYAEFNPENPPLITVRFDEASQTTQVLLGDRQTLVLNGNFTAEQLAVRLLTQEQLPF